MLVRAVAGDGVQHDVEHEVLRQSAVYATYYDCYGLDAAGREPPTFPFPEVDGATLAKVLEWCKEHEGMPLGNRYEAAKTLRNERVFTGKDPPTVDQNASTRERIQLPMSEWESAFLNVPFAELKKLIHAANYMDVRSLYLLSLQELATMLENLPPADIRTLLGESAGLNRCATEPKFLLNFGTKCEY